MSTLIRILVLVLFIQYGYANQKILIISHHYAQPYFIELQAKTFHRFIEDEYEFVIFNDAKTRQLEEEINLACKKNNLRCIRIPQEIHNRPYLPRCAGEDFNNPGVRCANVVQYSLDVLGFSYPGVVVIIDSDMFFTKPFSFNQYMQGFDLVALPQQRGSIHYIWNGIVMFNMPSLPGKSSMSFNCGKIGNTFVDAGGYMHFYLKKYASRIKVKQLNTEPFKLTIKQYRENSLPSYMTHLVPLLQLDPPSNMETFLEGAILHYRGGGKWEKKDPDYYERKKYCIQKYLNDLMNP